MLTIPNIRTSVENQQILVLDEHAREGIFLRDNRQRLLTYAGGFSVVFPYETANGDKWAFRCWHADINKSHDRFDIISEAIRRARLPFLCDFEYVEMGINVEGVVYPTIRMRWVDGVTIKDYICQNRHAKKRLLALADKFLLLTRALHRKSLAHGDLQHGNILVSKDHRLHLVDYDSFYCPQLDGAPDEVTGLPDYQHPARTTNKSVSEKLDYFSELVIYLSILAIAEDETLIDKYHVDQAERLLFSKEDYSNFEDSVIYKDVSELGKQYQELLDVLKKYLGCQDINELHPFEEVLLENKIKFLASTEKAVRNAQKVTLKWDVPFDAKIVLGQGGTDNRQEYKRKGKIQTSLSNDTDFILIVETKSKVQIKKTIQIKVFDECKIDFKADKYYIYPSIPVVLSWNVKDAKKVWLDSEKVKAKGTKLVEPKQATSYVLSAEDEFGKKEKCIEIQMLPIPQVRTLLVPTPKLTNNLALTVLQPRFNVGVTFPKIEMKMVTTKPPKVPSLTDWGINVELSPPLPKLGFVGSIKKMFNRLKWK